MINLTDIGISEHIEKVVALGPKFNVGKLKLEQKDRIEDVKNVEKVVGIILSEKIIFSDNLTKTRKKK